MKSGPMVEKEQLYIFYWTIWKHQHRVFDNKSMPLNLKSHYINFKDNLQKESDNDVELIFTDKKLGSNCIVFEEFPPKIVGFTVAHWVYLATRSGAM